MNDEVTGGTEFDTGAAMEEISGSLFGDETAVPEDDGPNLDGAGDTAVAEKPAAETPAEEAAPETPVTPEAKPAPRTWRPEAAAAWATLPPTVQDEVIKREEEIFRGIEQYKTDATFGKGVQQAIAPYQAMLQQFNVAPQQAVSQLLAVQQTLINGTPEQKKQLVEGVIRTYGITLDPAGEAPYIDPQVAALQQKLQALESNQQRANADKEAEVRNGLRKELDAFATDPAHSYFDEVAEDIGALLRGGGAKDLKDAYEKAIWANPVTRAKEQARVNAESIAKAQKESEERAAAAKKASSGNVRSNAKTVSSTAPLGSIDDTLAATLRSIKERA